jgi:hypothetical protein
VAFVNYLNSPPAIPVRGVGIRLNEKHPNPLQKRSAKFLSAVNAMKPQFHVSYDEQHLHVQVSPLSNILFAGVVIT